MSPASGADPVAPAPAASPTPSATMAAVDDSLYQVVPSSCPAGEAPLVYGTQPTLSAPGAAEFEVWAEGGPDRHDVPVASGNSSGAGWRVPAGVLDRGATYAWRARPSGGNWSVPRAFTVNTDLPGIVECRLDGRALLGLSFRAADAGIDLERALDVYGWQLPFADLAVALARDLPGDFAAWGLDDADPRRGWLAFRAGIPAPAAERVESLRATWPTAAVEVRSGRGYTDLELSRRMYAALGAVLRQFDKVLDADATAAGATGTISLTVQRHPAAAGTDAELADVLRRAVQAETELSIVPPGEGVVATATVQPVGISFVRP